jgi:cold shock CspA family protein
MMFMTADARSTPLAEGARSNGDMLWFNSEKGHGFIETEAGDRLRVDGSDFRNGPPVGRVAGMAVTFRVMGDGDSARAQDVVFPDDAAPRRARIRRSAGR